MNTTGDTLGITANSLTSGTALALSSTATAFNGELLTLSKTAASGSTAFTSDIANLTYSQTFNAGVGLNSTGNVLDIGRAITLDNLGNTHTISGALVTVSDSGTQTAGTLTHTGNVLSLTQNYTSASGAVLSLTNAGTGSAIEIAGAGTRSINSTSGNLTLRTTTSGDLNLNPAGNLVINTTGGVVDIDDPTISLATQATDIDIIDNTASTLTISEGANNYFLITTTDGAPVVTLDTLENGGTMNFGSSNFTRTINVGTGTAADTINIGTGATTANTIAVGTGAVANTITIGSDQTTGLSLTDDNWNITAAGAASFVSLTQTGALTIAPTTTGTFLDFQLETEWTSGTLINADYASATTQAGGDITGLALNFNTNLTGAVDLDVTGINVQTPALSPSSGVTTTTYIGYNNSASGAITTSGTFTGTVNWRGANITMPNITQIAGSTVNAAGLLISNGTITTGGTQNMLSLSASGVGAGTLNGINIAGITGGAGTETAVNIGTGWDTDINATTSLEIAIGATNELVLDASALYPASNDGLALGVASTNMWSDLHLAAGGVINWANGEVTITETDTDTLTVAGATLIDIAAGILELNNAVRFDTGVATVATAYSVGRNADGTNLMQFNVPTGASFELSVNDTTEVTLSATAVNFQDNSITTTGGGSLTGTWTDLGSVTTIDINGGTIDGTTIGVTTPSSGAFTTLTSSGNTTLGTGASGAHTFGAGAGSTVGIGNTTGAVTISSGGTSAWTNTSGDVTLRTATSGNILLNSIGNVGIGGTAPSTAPYLFVGSTGNVGIGTTNPATKLDVAGTITATGVSSSGTINFSGLTASRLLSTDASKNLASTDLNSWVAGTTNELTVTDDGDGTVTLSLPDVVYLGTAGKLGRDADNLLDFSTDNQITFRVGAADELVLTASALYPSTSLGLDLGGSSNYFNDLYLNGASIYFDDATDSTFGFDAAADKFFFNVAGAGLATSEVVIDGNGNVGIGTTSPSALLEVVGQCVTGDTLLRRRRRKRGKNGGQEDEWEDVPIKDIKVGDEIQTLDEATGALVVSKVKALMDMGTKAIFKMTTASGKTIRTTGNHPYLVKTTPDRRPRAGVFVDDANMFYAQKRAGWRIDYEKLENYLSADFDVRFINYYLAMPKKEDRKAYKKTQAFITKLPTTINLITKPLKYINEKIVADDGKVTIYRVNKKSDVDLDIAVDVLNKLDNLDAVIILSGDSDFVKLRDDLLAKGKKILFISHNDNLAIELREGKFATLQKLEKFIRLDNKEKAPAFGRGTLLSYLYHNVADLSSPSTSSGLMVSMVEPSSGKWQKVTSIKKGDQIAVAGRLPAGKAGFGKAVWDKVVKIEKMPAEQVYDIEVEGTHNFVGNEIVAHNTYISSSSGKLGIQYDPASLSTGTVLGINGNVGIGKTSPLATLDVSGSANFGTTTATTLSSTGLTELYSLLE